MILMRLRAVKQTKESDNAVALLETFTDARILALVMPLDEAHRLARAAGLGGCRYVPIYELIDALIGALDTKVARVVLDAYADGIGAAIVLEGASAPLPCHPADALALALRADAPIYATWDALVLAYPRGSREHRPLPSPSPESLPVTPDVASWLDRVRPADFASGNGPAGDGATSPGD